MHYGIEALNGPGSGLSWVRLVILRNRRFGAGLGFVWLWRKLSRPSWCRILDCFAFLGSFG